MLIQKQVLAPRLTPVLASACELEYQILLLVDAHSQAKKLSDDYRRAVAAKKGFPKLNKFLSILMSSVGLKADQEVAYLRACCELRNLLVHGAYRSAVQGLAALPLLRIQDTVASFAPPLGFAVT